MLNASYISVLIKEIFFELVCFIIFVDEIMYSIKQTYLGEAIMGLHDHQ